MTKNLSLKLAMLGLSAASCLVGVAHADSIFDVIDNGTGERDDVTFVRLDPDLFPDVACIPAGGVGGSRSVELTLQNHEPADLRLYDARLMSFNDDNSGVNFDFDVSGCITSTDPVTNYGQGLIAGFGQCVLTAQFTPPDCDNTGQSGQDVPMFANIHKLLVIGVGSQQDYLLLEANAEVDVIGSGSEFAVLGFEQAPTNEGNGTSQIYGDLGVTDPGDGGEGFTLPNSAAVYTSQLVAPVVGAEADLENAYLTLIGDVDFGGLDNCIPYGDMDLNDVITTGNYCLSDANISDDLPPVVTPIDVVVDGTVIFSGPGNFYLFMDPVQHCVVSTGPLVERMCNLRVGPNFNVVYDADQNGDRPGPENVFWILGGIEGPVDTTAPTPPLILGSADLNHVYLANGARFDGSILGGAGADLSPKAGSFAPFIGNNIIAEDGTGDRAVNINGTLWSRYGLIMLAGTSVWPSH